MKRARIQNGSVVYNKRFGSWNFLWVVGGQRRSRKLGDLSELPTKQSALKKAEALRMELRFRPPTSVPTVRALVEQYRTEKMPSRYSTRRGYDVWLKNYILPRWGEQPITAFQPRPAEMWLSSQNVSPKSRGHIRRLMHIIWDYARWSGLVSVQANPISLVTVRGSSRRTRQPRSLTVDELQRFLCRLEDPFRTISLVCVCFGLWISECLALKWSDVDWLNGKLSIERGIVRHRVDDLKTIYSGRKMSIDAGMLTVLKAWRQATQFSSDEDWVFVFSGKTRPSALVLRSSMAIVPERCRRGWHRQARDSQHETYVSLIARRSRTDRCGPAKTDASRGHPDDDERVRGCGHERNASGPFQGGADGSAEAELIC